MAWAFPYPSLEARCEHLRAWSEPHGRAGRDVVLVAETIESPQHLTGVLAAVGAEEHVLVRLNAAADTLRERIVAREPPGWSGLEMLLGETRELVGTLAALDGVDLVLDSERLTVREIAERVRDARPDRLRR